MALRSPNLFFIVPVHKPIYSLSTDFLPSAGDMANSIRQFDWQRTPLGPIAVWPQSLRTAASMALHSRYPMFIAWGPSLTFLYNDAYLPILGTRHPDALGKPFREIWFDIWQDLLPLVETALSGTATWSEDLPLVMERHGFPEETFFTFSYSPLHDERGRIAGMFCTCTETTEKVRANQQRMVAEAALLNSQAALHEANQRLNNIVVQAPVGIAQADSNDRLVLVNKCYCDMLGRSESELIGMHVRDITHRDDWEVNASGLRRLFNEGRSYVQEKRYLRPDGSSIWVNLHVARVVDMEGRAQYATAVVQDITERKRAEAALKRLNETLEQQVNERTADRNRMWRLSTDVMLVATLEGQIVAINPAWGALLGWQEQEIVATNFMELVHQDDVEPTTLEVQKLAEGITTLHFENRYRCKDGTYRWLSWTAVPDERFIHAVGRDVTLEKERIKALRDIEETLRQSQKMEAVGQLTGGIAHDFNNLLQAIGGSLELALQYMELQRAEELPRLLEKAVASVNRAGALTHRLLAFSRQQPLDAQPVDVNALIDASMDLLRRTLGETIAIDRVPATPLPAALCDANQLENALLNLAINARDAMRGGGVLTIDASLVAIGDAVVGDLKSGRYVMIRVGDSGCGMGPEVLSRAFEPFFTTKPAGQGTGLGLSMIYGFARQSGGHVELNSRPGHGTQVRLFLPCEEGPTPQPIVQRRLLQTPSQRRGRIMVVEDQQVVRDLIIEVLERKGHTVLHAEDGLAGIALIESGQPFDLLITDFGLPGANGQRVAAAARQRYPGVPVLFITGYAENATLPSELAEAGMELIAKPFAMQAFGERIAEMLAR